MEIFNELVPYDFSLVVLRTTSIISFPLVTVHGRRQCSNLNEELSISVH
jgi:hypothetical protein